SSGKIIKKLSSVVRNNEIDDFDFIESSGTWSPDGRQFAFVVFDKGVSKLAILDVQKAKFSKEIEMPGIRSFSNPAWSPDGKKIVFTGQVDGISDLYLYDLKTGGIDRLTNDFTANLLPSWSSDGNSIVYSQEKVNAQPNQRKFSFSLAILDLKSKNVIRVNVFNDAYNMNPWFSNDDKLIYFLSDADGFRNLYRYDLGSRLVYRLTDYMTGITGITEFSPALSVAKGENLIAYNYYFDYKYQILAARPDEFKPVQVDGNYVNFDAGTLPPLPAVARNVVDSTLYNRKEVTIVPRNKFQPEQYKSKFKLDYISNNATIGVSTGMFRNYGGGSINAIFSDMVGNNQLYSSLSLNGEIYDFGGQVAYLNQKGKIKWGAAISHIPYVYAQGFIGDDSLTIQDVRIPVTNLAIDYLRMFEDNISLFAALPFSQTRRIEASASASWFYYRIDQFNNYYTPDGIFIGSNRQKLPAPKGDNFQQGSLAYVEDNSYFGMTSPMQGHRERFEVDKYFGAANIYTTLFDYRRYFYVKPFSLAFRLYNFGMWGKDAETGVIPPFYLGYPWLVRGYENVGYGNNSYDNSFDITRLSGTKILVGNAELRLPLTGPQRLAVIKSKWVLTDLNLFFDSGLAWQKGNNIKFENPSPTAGQNDRFPIYSAGFSIRVNVFGYLVLEPYYAFPFQYGGFKNGQFGLNFIPGW
ncbi:MAG: tolB protein precursor, partial [Bacteroidota bacterium]|nr:tolB protein precursor [Bacteroidota bacterium]